MLTATLVVCVFIIIYVMFIGKIVKPWHFQRRLSRDMNSTKNRWAA